MTGPSEPSIAKALAPMRLSAYDCRKIGITVENIASVKLQP